MASTSDSHVTRPPTEAPPIQVGAAPVDSTGTVPETRSDQGTAELSPSDPMQGVRSPAAVSGHEILGELGRGGMGVVYRARQIGLNRMVALKMILSGNHAGRQELARFKAEAEAIARLQHPNIVQIHEIGEHDGLPFFALEFCAGGSLARKLDGKPLSAEPAAQLVETLARAMAAAHRASIVHRDLKPANVLLTGDGVPKIADFGLAKRLDEAGLTGSGAVMGTPSYMAPEQARGEVRTIGPAADIYALGAILYECLVGHPPFKADSAFATITQVIFDEPAPPSRIQRTLPRDLETICLKCLQKDPAKRYASADELADDLARFLAGEPIAARPVGRLERAWRRVRRNPVLAGVGVAAVGLLVVVVLLVMRGDPPRPDPVVAPPAPREEEVLQAVAELDRSDRVWRLEHLPEFRRTLIPDEQNAALRVQAAKRSLPPGWPGREQQQLLDNLHQLPPRTPLTPQQAAAVRASWTQVEPALAEARPLAGFSRGRYLVSWNRDAITTPLPHLVVVREVSQLLLLDSALRCHDGDIDGSLHTCQALLNAGRSIGDEPLAISQLSRIACAALACRALERSLGQGNASESALAAVQKLLEDDTGQPMLLSLARGERASMHWLMTAIEVGDFKLSELLVVMAKSQGETPDPAVIEATEARLIPSVRASHAWLLRHLTEFVEIAKLPVHEQLDRVQGWPGAVKAAPDVAHLMAIDGPKLIAANQRHQARLRCATVAVAAERFRLQHNRWPEKLADLSPKLLKQILLDPYDGQPLRLRHLPDGIVVYAVGPDGMDDNGNLDRANPDRAGSDLGFRLWDHEKRRPAASDGVDQR